MTIVKSPPVYKSFNVDATLDIAGTPDVKDTRGKTYNDETGKWE
jgi:hypothetical protein